MNGGLKETADKKKAHEKEMLAQLKANEIELTKKIKELSAMKGEAAQIQKAIRCLDIVINVCCKLIVRFNNVGMYWMACSKYWGKIFLIYK